MQRANAQNINTPPATNATLERALSAVCAAQPWGDRSEGNKAMRCQLSNRAAPSRARLTHGCDFQLRAVRARQARLLCVGEVQLGSSRSS
jgi:hypothetical protein